MGSIPVAGAKKGELLCSSPFLAPARRTHPRATREIGFAYPVRRSTSSLVRRRTWVYSPKAKFPLRLSLFVPAIKLNLAQRARLSSHTPSEDRQARLSGEGRGYIRRRRNSRVNNRIADNNLFCPLRPHAHPALPKGEPFRIKAYDFPDFNLRKQKTNSSDA